MAEGDTIKRLADRFEQAMVGDRVSVRFPGQRRPDGRAADLDGRELLDVESRGKHLLLRFSEDLVLHSHLGMKGVWHIYALRDRWRKPARNAWIALSGERAAAVNFNGTKMRVVRERELARDPRLARLGRDILSPGLDSEQAAASLRRAGPDVELGDAMLDQTLLAGIGNIFKSEGCWAARIDPWRKLGDLSDPELASAAGAARDLMLAAVRSGRQPKRVYRRSRLPCPRCRTPIRSRPQGDSARVTYWCTRCQR
jgi:endonuclease VIII